MQVQIVGLLFSRRPHEGDYNIGVHAETLNFCGKTRIVSE